MEAMLLQHFWLFDKTQHIKFFPKTFFDDIAITNYVPDVIAPVIQSATAISSFHRIIME